MRPTPEDRTVGIAADDRARIPFALLGALLLVTSVSVATMIEGTPSGEIESPAAEATDRLAAAESTALREGTRAAGATAAADPVVTPSNTTFGTALDDDRPYRSYLELLVYLEVQSRLEATSVRLDDVTASSRLQPVGNATAAETAIDRTSVERAGPGAVDVTVEGVERVVVRGDRELHREQRTIEARVATPALTLHRRTEEYESRLDAGPATPGTVGPGFSGRVNGIAWGRGLAQYAGVPIEQVLAPRHVELAFNDAVRAQQRAVFGSEDERLRRGLARQSAHMVEGAVNVHSDRENVSAGIRDPNAPPGPPLQDDYRPEWFERDREPQPTTVEVGPHAERALDRLLVGDGGPSLEVVIQDVYSADVRASTVSRITSTTRIEEPNGIGSDWELVDTTESMRVIDVSDGPGKATTSLPPGWRTVEEVDREVRTERTIVRTYERDDERTRTYERRQQTHAVAIELGIRVGYSDHAPERSTGGFDAKGTFEGIEEQAVRSYYTEIGPPDRLAEHAVRNGTFPTVTVDTAPPPELSSDLRDELWSLKNDLGGVSVRVDRARIATSENPHAELAATLDTTAGDYVRAPASYTGPAQKAHVAARAAYLDRLIDELETGAAAVDSAQSGIDVAARIETAAGGAPADDVLVASTDVTAPPAEEIETASPVRSLELTVESDPGYLDAGGVDAEHVRTADEPHYPVAIRTINAVSLPSGEIADRVGEAMGDLLFGNADEVALTTAARSLAAIEEVPPEARTDRLEAHRSELRTEVRDGLGTVQQDAADGLADVTELEPAERRAVVETGFDRWNSLDDKVQAASNGTAASAIADEVVAHSSTPSKPSYRERVEIRVATAISDSLDETSARVPEGPITDALDSARGETEAAVADTAERGLERGEQALNERLRSGKARVPLGVPVAPPYAWVATVNGWTVEVRGEYATFAIETNRGGPANAPVTYQRHGNTVRLDIDGDGTPERLGTADRIAFSTWTTAIVAVPPGKSGVGNTDGRMVLRTAAWPDPGPGTPDNRSDRNRTTTRGTPPEDGQTATNDSSSSERR